jgi:hypothetical protein
MGKPLPSRSPGESSRPPTGLSDRRLTAEMQVSVKLLRFARPKLILTRTSTELIWKIYTILLLSNGSNPHGRPPKWSLAISRKVR